MERWLAGRREHDAMIVGKNIYTKRAGVWSQGLEMKTVNGTGLLSDGIEPAVDEIQRAGAKRSRLGQRLASEWDNGEK